jgi:hypothetical protein
VTGPLRGNRTWQVTDDIIREQVCGGAYRYHTPVGLVMCLGNTGSWILHYDKGWTTELKTLADTDAVIASWIAELREAGVVEELRKSLAKA